MIHEADATAALFPHAVAAEHVDSLRHPACVPGRARNDYALYQGVADSPAGATRSSSAAALLLEDGAVRRQRRVERQTTRFRHAELQRDCG
jgi:hypothetical protein